MDGAGEVKLKVKAGNVFNYSFGVFFLVSAVFIFYVLVRDLGMVHLGLVGVLSLITAFGVFMREKWSVWLAFLVFCGGNAFAVALLFNPLTIEFGGLIIQIGLIVYVVLLWAAMFYLVSKRKEFY